MFWKEGEGPLTLFDFFILFLFSSPSLGKHESMVFRYSNWNGKSQLCGTSQNSVVASSK